MKNWLKKFQNSLYHPLIDLGVGIVLLFAAFSELDGDFLVALSEDGIGLHHGILVLGGVHLLGAFRDLLSSSINIIEKREDESRP